MVDGKSDAAGTLPSGELTQDSISALRRNLDEVRARIAAACRRSDRNPREVTLVAVTKTVSPAVIRVLAEHGQLDFGENRVQEALAKIPECPSGLRWHMIGHLQRNKAARALERFDVVHAVDTVQLGLTLEGAAGKAGRTVPFFLEVNVSGEASKHGFAPGEVVGAPDCFAHHVWALPAGLMTMAPFDPDPERARPHFRALRELRDRVFGNKAHLSMGMSQDFEVAVEEGATYVRVGSALFRDVAPCRG